MHTPPPTPVPKTSSAIPFLEDIDAILERDPAARGRFEVLTCYPGLHALWSHRLNHALWRTGFAPLRWLARFLAHLTRLFTGVEIHPGAQLGRRVFIDHGHGVVIGETAEIGDDCTIYQGVTLGGTSLVKGSKRHPTLEVGVVVGAGAKVLGPFTVGAGARIGSNAVVVRAVPAGATAIGIPARVVGQEAHAEPLPSGDPATGFRAYGVSPDQPDPLDVLLHQLMDELKAQKAQVEALSAQLGRAASGSDENTRHDKP